MKRTIEKLSLAIAGAGLLTLYGCGGSDSVLNPITPAPTTTVPITVIDGLIKDATVCLDINNNGACDTGEPFALTGADGKANLVVDSTLAGKHPVIAVVGTNAIDMDRPTTPITVPFTLKAPADQTAVITPLTTMVQNVVESTGVTSANAEAQVKQSTGLNVSLFADFTKDTTSADNQAAATVARMAVVTTQQQSEAVKAAIGTKDTEGAVITKSDLDRAIQKRLLEMLPSLLAALQDPAVTGAATPAAKEAALLAQANTLLTNEGLTSTSAATVVAINKQATVAVAAATPTAGFSLANLSVTDLYNWYVRMMTATDAQNTPDSAGNTKYVERRSLSAGDFKTSAVANWGAGSNPSRQADIHWNGTTWANCPINFENTSKVRDANGNAAYNYCDNREIGTNNRASFDVTGKPMIDVYKQMQAAGYTNITIGAADNVLATQLLGTTVFPTGSVLQYQTGTSVTNAITYYPGTSNYVMQGPIGVGAGRTSTADTTALCATNTLPDTPASSLDTLIAQNKGTPCVNAAATAGVSNTLTSGTTNDSWGVTSLSLGVIGTAAANATKQNATSFYTTNTPIRVAFGAPGVANFFSCQQRYDGSPRNCKPIGTGTYTLQTIGGARTLSFTGLPALATALNFVRVFVEREGKIYYGSQSRPSVNKTARLNTAAATALLQKINSNFAANPAAPLVLTAASYQGIWDAKDTTVANDPGVTVTINKDGTASCVSNTNPAPTCSATITSAGTSVVTLSTTPTPVTASVTLDFLAGTGSGTLNTTGNVVVTRR